MKFDKPIELSDVEAAFSVEMKRVMPAYTEIPEEFKQMNNKFVKLQQEWFFEGLDARKLITKKGIDRKRAFRHLKAIQSSFEPKHEHKEAGVAYLMSLWFETPTEKEGKGRDYDKTKRI